MAEGHEESKRLLTTALTLAYMEIRDAYLALPLPIRLPDGEELRGLELPVIHQALFEAQDRIADLPVDTIAGMTLTQSTMHWICGSVLVQAFFGSEIPSHLAAATWSLEQASDLVELAVSMLRQE